MKTKISVVFSTFNESNNSYFKKSLERLSGLKHFEVIVVDGGSTDGTQQLCESFGAQVFHLDSLSRGKRLDFGVSKASHNFVLLHHPRSIIDSNGLTYLLDNFEKLNWGGFTHCFDQDEIGLSFTSWYSNRVRGAICEILYLDHCIFFKKELLKSNPIVPHSSIFEDTKLSLKLRQVAPVSILPYRSLTSSIRFQKNGFLKQGLLNQVMKICFYMNLSDDLMNKVYEKGLSLNSKY